MSAAIMPDNGLVAMEVCFSFYHKAPWLLNKINLTIAPGESLGLTGPSGFGKTTLARLLGGFLKPDKGKILFNGQPLPKRGFCPVQYIYQHPELAINPRWKAGKILTEAHNPSAELLEALEISASWLDRYPHELSGGELQRLAIARALTSDTRCLIADELSAMLDPLTQALIWKALIDFKRKNNLSWLVISHDNDLLAKVCDRVVDLNSLNE